MGDIKMADAGSLKKGQYVIVDGIACTVVDVAISRPGKHGHAKINFNAVGLLDGKKRNVVMPGHDAIQVPIIEKKNAQVLSINGTHANVMETESYETFDMLIPEEMRGQLKEGQTVLYWVIMNDRIIKQIKPE